MYAALEKSYTIEEAYENLGFAVVERAVIDYSIALRKMRRAKGEKEEAATRSTVAAFENFFNSDWCYQLTQGRVSSEAIISRMRAKVLGSGYKKSH